LIDSLRRTIESLKEPKGRSAWRRYYDETDHYSDAASSEKDALVDRWIAEAGPKTVWDLGANTGRFSRLASARGIETVAIDSDPFCIDEAYEGARRAGDTHLTAIVSDLTNPSPGLGWENQERSSLEDRGPADLVLALAVIHHLAIANNVPLPMVVDQLARVGRSAIVEFVPKTDPKVQRLLRDRDDIFDAYTEAAFEESAGERFTIVHREPLADSGRALYLIEAR
jgi:ribosomal protein L11 methylase PrmA